MVCLITALVCITLASVADGLVSGFEFDGRRSFERKYHVHPKSFWGSKSWTKKNNWYARNFGVFDFFHVADDLRKYGYLSGGALFAWAVTQLGWSIGIWGCIAVALSIFSKRMALDWVRSF